MISIAKRIVRKILNALRDLRDAGLSLTSGVFLHQFIADARLSGSEDLHKSIDRIAAKQEHILILVPCKDVARFLPTLERNLLALSYPKHLLSIGFLESDSSDNTYELLQNIKQNLTGKFAEVFLLQHTFVSDLGMAMGAVRDSRRWKTHKQLDRRSIIAKVRNYLLDKCLNDKHQWVLWVDSDVIQWDNDCIEQLLSFNKEIIVPHCVREDNGRTFDLNSFKYTDNKKRNWQSYFKDGLIQPPVGYGRLYLEDFPEHDLISLDGLGGTMMLVKADIHRQGLIYPDYIIHKHIETEALAFMAREMGYECWGTPQVTIVHPIY